MYKEMYLILFRAIVDVLEENDIDIIKKHLILAQSEAEEVCINSDEQI